MVALTGESGERGLIILNRRETHRARPRKRNVGRIQYDLLIERYRVLQLQKMSGVSLIYVVKSN